jgi:hypothetical protein
MQNNLNINPIQELSTFNRNSGFLVQLLYKGVESGGISLSDNENVAAIRSLTQHLCDVSRFFLEHANQHKVMENAPIETLEFRNKLTINQSKTDAVLNSDVTVEKGVAYEPSLSHRVSEFGDDVNDHSNGSIVHDVSSNEKESRQTPSSWHGDDRKRKQASGDETSIHRTKIVVDDDEDDEIYCFNNAMNTVAKVFEYVSLCCRDGEGMCPNNEEQFVNIGKCARLLYQIMICTSIH